MMKKNLLRSLKLLSLLLAVVAALGVLQEFVFYHTDHNSQRLKGYYLEDDTELDLVILGASEVYSDFAPGYAYQKSGVTGYLFATQSNSILNYKSQLKNILSRQKPGLIVIELNAAVYGDEEEATKSANLHNYADNVPLDGIKLDYVLHTVPEHKAEYIFPILKYHGAWDELSTSPLYRRTIEADRQRGYNYLKGILNETRVYRSSELSYNTYLPELADRRQPLTAIEEEGLRDLLRYCRDEGLNNVVFARFPHIVVTRTYDRFERSNTVGDIVAEYGYDYLNLERDIALTGLDEKNDFYNLDHLNVYGQQKFTAYLTDYLTEHYGLSAHTLTADEKAEWDACARYYDAYCRYSDELIRKGDARELSEDADLIETLTPYLN